MRASIVLVVVLLPLWGSLARAQQPPDQGAEVGGTGNEDCSDETARNELRTTAAR
jgi:hypothetical protein